MSSCWGVLAGFLLLAAVLGERDERHVKRHLCNPDAQSSANKVKELEAIKNPAHVQLSATGNANKVKEAEAVKNPSHVQLAAKTNANKVKEAEPVKNLPHVQLSAKGNANKVKEAEALKNPSHVQLSANSTGSSFSCNWDCAPFNAECTPTGKGLGSGRYGEVVQAKCNNFMLAAKCVQATDATDVYVSRAEAQIGLEITQNAKLKATRGFVDLAHVYDCGDGQQIFVMEQITGGNLADALDQGTIEEGSTPAKAIIFQVLFHLYNAWNELGFVHADLTVNNIFFRDLGPAYKRACFKWGQSGCRCFGAAKGLLKKLVVLADYGLSSIHCRHDDPKSCLNLQITDQQQNVEIEQQDQYFGSDGIAPKNGVLYDELTYRVRYDELQNRQPDLVNLEQMDQLQEGLMGLFDCDNNMDKIPFPVEMHRWMDEELEHKFACRVPKKGEGSGYRNPEEYKVLLERIMGDAYFNDADSTKGACTTKDAFVVTAD